MGRCVCTSDALAFSGGTLVGVLLSFGSITGIVCRYSGSLPTGQRACFAASIGITLVIRTLLDTLRIGTLTKALGLM
jgi:hypothetical protein